MSQGQRARNNDRRQKMSTGTAERDRLISEARESLRIGFLTLIEVGVLIDHSDDDNEELGQELYDLSHTLMHQVMVKLADVEKKWKGIR